MAQRITDWFVGSERQPPVSTHFSVVDGQEISGHTDNLIDDLARRMMEAKTSRGYLERYAPVLGWDFVAQRVAAGPQRVQRGDFGEVVACGWLEDYAELVVPVKKLQTQINPGQTLPSTDAVAFRITDGLVDGAHFLEAKLRTKNVMISTVAKGAYQQLVADRKQLFREALQFVHEQLHRAGNPLVDAVTEYLQRRDPADEDSHEIVLLFEKGVWSEDVLTELDGIAGALTHCRVHSLLATDLAAVIDATFARAGMELIDIMEEE